MKLFRTLYLLIGTVLVFMACSDDVFILERDPVDPCQGDSETIDAQICEGQSYTLPDGEIVTDAGTYVVTVGNGGCDDTFVVNLTIGDSFSIEINAGICEGGEYELPDGQVVTEAGSYVITKEAASGCDSIITTNLTVQDAFRVEESVAICACSEYELPDGVVVTEEGEYMSTLPGNLTCDTIVTTTVAFLEPSMEVVDEEICSGDQFQLPDLTLVTKEGYYVTEIIEGAAGCDSIVNYIYLTVNPSTTINSTVTAPIGQEYVLPDGTAVTTTNTYTSSFTSVDGCDSIYLQEVTFTGEGVYNISFDLEACQDSFDEYPNGTEYPDDPGQYTEVVNLMSASGQDSIITYNLTVHPELESAEQVSIAECEVYTLPDGRRVYEAGAYESILQSMNGCDSVVVTTLTVN